MFDAPEPAPKPKSRWWKYSLRTLLVLILLVSIPLSWAGRDVFRSMREAAVVRAIHEANGQTYYDYWQPDEFGNIGAKLEPEGNWLARKFLGENINSYVMYVDLRTAADPQALIPRLRHLSRLKYLILPMIPADEALVETLKQLPELETKELDLETCTPVLLWELAEIDEIETLYLHGSDVTDNAIEALLRFKNLKSLWLYNTSVTDAAMPTLAQIATLNELVLNDAPQVTNQGFQALAGMSQLTQFAAHGTQIDEGCVDVLREMPSLETLEITPGQLDLSYYPWGTIRLDTRQPIIFKPFFSDLRREESIRVVHIEADTIYFSEDDLIPIVEEVDE